MKTPLDRARAKLENPLLGALTNDEMKALFEASTPKRTHGVITQKVITELLEAAKTENPEGAILELMDRYNMRPSIEKVWDSEDAFKGIK